MEKREKKVLFYFDIITVLGCSLVIITKDFKLDLINAILFLSAVHSIYRLVKIYSYK